MSVRTQPVTYLVTIWPEGHECTEVTLFSLLVQYRGNGQWAVEQGWTTGDRKLVLGSDGRWHTDDPNNPLLRFPLEDALHLAGTHAEQVTLHGVTAAEALAQHQEHGCPDR